MGSSEENIPHNASLYSFFDISFDITAGFLEVFVFLKIVFQVANGEHFEYFMFERKLVMFTEVT